MKYMGSKNRIAYDLLNIVLADKHQNQWYVEPFCGGCNILDKVDGKRMANDIHKNLIEMWKALQWGWCPPRLITEEMYQNAMKYKNYPPELIAYIGFSISFGGKYFGGYRRDKAGERTLSNMKLQSVRSFKSIISQSQKLKEVVFTNLNYWEMDIPENSIIYCDPPYQGTTSYKSSFDHDKFWQWCRDMSKHCKVFISEYDAPEDFKNVWGRIVKGGLISKSCEKLFIYKEISC